MCYGSGCVMERRIVPTVRTNPGVPNPAKKTNLRVPTESVSRRTGSAMDREIARTALMKSNVRIILEMRGSDVRIILEMRVQILRIILEMRGSDFENNT